MLGTGGITAFVVGAMIAVSCVLLLACLAIKLDEWGIHPLRTHAGLVKRSWFERLLLLFMVGGLVQYAATKGTNGDGLSDYDEIHIYDTDPLMADSDGDGISDLDEIQEETEPTDCESYYRRIAYLTETVDDLISVTNYVTWGFVGSGWEFDHQVVDTNGVLSSVFRELPLGTNIYTKAYRDLNRNGVCDPDSDYLIVHETLINKIADTVIFSFSDGDRDSDGMSDYWEYEHSAAGLSPTNSTDAALDPDNDGLVNLHEYWAGCDPMLADGSNTVLHTLCNSIDSRIAGITNAESSLPIYDNYYVNGANGVFIRNSDCWAADLDFSCLSVWNSSYESHSHGGTAISKRHVLFARHWLLSNNTTLTFVGTNGETCVRTITGVRTAAGDIAVASLNADLPDSVSVVPVLSSNAVERIRTGKLIPIICVNQDKKALVREINSVAYPWSGGDTVSHALPKKTSRVDFSDSVRRYDSGSPSFIVSRNRLVLIGTHWTTGSDSSTALSCDIIQALMDSLVSGYSLHVEDFVDD